MPHYVNYSRVFSSWHTISQPLLIPPPLHCWGGLSPRHTCRNSTAFTKGEKSLAVQIQTNRSSKTFQLALECRPWVHNLYLNTGVSGVWGICNLSKKSMNPPCDCQNAIQLPPPLWFRPHCPPLYGHHRPEHQYAAEMPPAYAYWFPNALKRRHLTREQ